MKRAARALPASPTRGPAFPGGQARRRLRTLPAGLEASDAGKEKGARLGLAHLPAASSPSTAVHLGRKCPRPGQHVLFTLERVLIAGHATSSLDPRQFARLFRWCWYATMRRACGASYPEFCAIRSFASSSPWLPASNCWRGWRQERPQLIVLTSAHAGNERHAKRWRRCGRSRPHGTYRS